MSRPAHATAPPDAVSRPSHVTLLGVAIGLLGAAGLATVSYWGRLGGTLLLIVSLVLDCVDGDMARARLAQRPGGARLDVIGDYLVNLAVFAGLADRAPARGTAATAVAWRRSLSSRASGPR